MNIIARLLKIKNNEVILAIFSFLLFFFLFSSYTILRPLREVMGIASGLDNLKWLFLATFVAVLLLQYPYTLFVSKIKKEHILTCVYAFFVVNMVFFALILYADATSLWTGRVFYVWLSIYNLEIVSLGFSFLNDLFSNAKSRRLFAIATSGSSLGSVAGPTLTAFLSMHCENYMLFIVSSLMLLFSILIVKILRVIISRNNICYQDEVAHVENARELKINSDIYSGIKAVFKERYIFNNALYILCASATTTALYFLLMDAVAAYFSGRAEQTLVFSLLDIIVNSFTIFLQLFITGRIAQRFGLWPLLVIIPLIMFGGFMINLWFPSFIFIASLMTLRRIGQYALIKPGKEMLFNILSTDDKYKAKNFIDTVVYPYTGS